MLTPTTSPAVPTMTPGETSPARTAVPDTSPSLEIPGNQPTPRTVTLSEAGNTLTLAVGERFELQLGQGYDWELDVTDGRVLSQLEEEPDGGVFLARQPGQTELTAVGDPECLKVRPPCAMPSIFYRLLVIVR